MTAPQRAVWRCCTEDGIEGRGSGPPGRRGGSAGRTRALSQSCCSVGSATARFRRRWQSDGPARMKETRRCLEVPFFAAAGDPKSRFPTTIGWEDVRVVPGQSNRPVSVTAPPRAAPCPAMDLLSEFTTRPAPTSRGLNRTGEVMVLSTMYSRPHWRHNSPIASRSGTGSLDFHRLHEHARGSDAELLSRHTPIPRSPCSWQFRGLPAFQRGCSCCRTRICSTPNDRRL